LDNKARAALLAQIWVDPEGFPAIYFAFPKSQLSEKYSSSSGEQETSLLNGLRPAIYSGLRKSELDREITLTTNPQGSKSAHRTLELTDFQLDLYGEVEENVDKANRRITFKRTGASGRAVVSNGKIEGWSLQFDDVSGHVKDVSGGEQNFDRNGLTGCLTIIDAQLRDLNFSVNNATCEDAINFVRVNGNVKSGSIKVTAFDAVDADFSQLKFDQLSVEKAGNDCLDLSYGDYQASNLQLIECGDKAISVGETSKASIKNLYARDVEIGLAAKDYGTILVDVAKIENSRKCYDLYNKKQEFSGGLLQINANSLDCGGAVGNVGLTSLVRGNIGY